MQKGLVINRLLATVGVITFVILVAIFFPKEKREEIDSLTKIKREKTLTIITDNSAHTYYTYRNEDMGFEYELAKEFAKYLNVGLKIITPSWSEMIPFLQSGKGDIITAGLTITEERKKILNFSKSYLNTQQFIVVHKQNSKIKSLSDIKEIHIREETSYKERLKELDGELNATIILHEDTPTEELLRQVANKEIEATVSDSHIAYLNRRYYPDLFIAFPIEEEEEIGWAIKNSDRELLREINNFFSYMSMSGKLSKIYKKYFGNIHIYDYLDIKKFQERIEVRLPKYEKTIKKYSKKYGFDWRLISAIIYQESQFNHRAKSYTGVRGLMQLTIPTARDMGIRSRVNPYESIRGGTKYLRILYDKLKDKNITEDEKIFFALASYNVGYGHVLDAQRIAKKLGLNPNKWSSIRETLPLLRERKYYKDTKYGYARGTEPVEYVKRIFIYYDILKREGIEYIKRGME